MKNSSLFYVVQLLKFSPFQNPGVKECTQSYQLIKKPDSTPLTLAEETENFDVDPMHRQETIELVKAYYKIPNRKAAKCMYDLIIAMSKTTYNNSHDEDVEK